MLVRLLLTATLVSLLCTECIAQNTPVPTPQELLAHWKQRRLLVENLFVDVEWQEFENGKATKNDHQTLYSDKLGRLCITSRVAAPGAVQRVTTEVYNGESTITVDEDPKRTGLGEPVKAGAEKAGDIYLAAIINEGLGQDGKGPFSRRNPFTIVDDGPLNMLGGIIAANGHPTVRELEGQPGVFEVLFQRPLADDPIEFQHRCITHRDKGWAITLHEMRSEKAGILASASCDLQMDSLGTWLPQTGVYLSRKIVPADAPPAIEWRFKVNTIKANDPEFNEGVFTIKLKSGTYVTDNRAKVSYKVGAEGAISDQLTSLAQEAAATNAATIERIERKPTPVEPKAQSSYRSVLIIGNLVALVGVFLFIVWRRSRA